MEPCSNYLGLLDNRYILVKGLDSSNLSATYKVFDSFTEKDLIAKIFKENHFSIDSEIEINQKISRNESPFFLKYINSSSGPFVMDEIKEYNKCYILFEYATKGNLLQYVNLKRRGFEEKISKVIFAKILKSIQLLHGLGICMKTIDLSNILLDGDNYDLKLSNFELSSLFINQNGEKILLKEKVKSFQNVAPEVIKGIPYDGEKADIFSLGLLLFSLVTGLHGLKATNTNHSSLDLKEKLFKSIKMNKIESFWKLLEKIKGIQVSQEFKKLFIKMVAINPKERPTVGEIYNDEWMNALNNLSENELKSCEQELINDLKSRNEILNNLK